MSPYLFALLGCLFLIALLAASEAALAATNRVRLRHLLRAQNEGESPGDSDLSRESQDFIAAVTIAANFPLVAAASLAVWLGYDRFGTLGAVWFALGVAILTLVVFQIAPRLLVSAPGALENPWWAKPARLLVAIFKPFVLVLLGLGRFILAPLGVLENRAARTPAENDEEIQDLIEAANSEGALEESKELIESIFTFGDTRVHEVMIPRPDMVALPHTASASEAVRIFQSSGLSRVPVYASGLDEIVGVLHIKDVLKTLQEGQRDFSPKELAREPLYIPDSLKIDGALATMRAQKTHLALVIDEFGGVAGLLTVEDILEELVGEIADEHDKRDDSLLLLNEKNAVVHAHLHADDLKERWGLSLPVEEFETVGGFVIEKLGREPRIGDRIELPDAILTVHSTRSKRPHRIFITKRERIETAPEESEEK